MDDKMKYKCGMYGGSSNQCEELIVVISEGINRNEIDVRVRYRWIYQITKHIGNVRIFILQDSAKTKQAYTEDYWMEDAAKVREFAGKKIDVVFCGSDYSINSFWVKCYPEAENIFFQRDNISSTEIRENVMSHWEWLPNIVRPYYVKKVLIIGGESTGKSTLTINLANYYNTIYLEEVGRDISERSGTDMLMLPEDFTDILLTHKLREREALISSNRVLFEDTDCLITKFYIQFLDGRDKSLNEKLADAIAGLNNYDLVMFLEPDVKFVQDGDRSPVIAADRVHYSNKIKELYKERGYNIEVISGDYQQRFLKSVSLIDKLLGRI
jgi:HTH-type transcriptional repressor of NAD biosynthesis genes